MQSTIEQKLRAGLDLIHLAIANESHMHSGPATDSHFKLTLVSDDFVGKRPVARHQMVYGLLRDELDGPVHALVIHAFSAEEWQAKGGEVPDSARCAGSPKN
ncbi:BolA family transcriptional regulator [Motiliproteus coralliicola]|uniref:BolA family transcriptional regulator n=1 Tax=Motiliproteus coralliicola TaxID=2283196 RepID=A0A369WUG4_9GAMM|nr:BolA family protein [Motiliproteus coralliicola]RDE25251.1 BolA family transcriptional regulator [Motiliproteus coralliicola]